MGRNSKRLISISRQRLGLIVADLLELHATTCGGPTIKRLDANNWSSWKWPADIVENETNLKQDLCEKEGARLV